MPGSWHLITLAAATVRQLRRWFQPSGRRDFLGFSQGEPRRETTVGGLSLVRLFGMLEGFAKLNVPTDEMPPLVDGWG